MRTGDQAEADFEGVINLLHHFAGDLAHTLLEALLVDGTDLFEEHDAVAGEAAGCCFDEDMGRELGFVALAGNRGGNHGGAVAVADVILEDQYRADAALLGAHDGAEVCVVYFAAFYGSHFRHLPFVSSPAGKRGQW